MNLTIYLVEEGPAMELSMVFEDSHWGPEAHKDGQEVAVEDRQPVIHPCLPPLFATVYEERSYRKYWLKKKT